MSPVARVLVGVTGGIAAYKACELVRLLVKGGHEVVPLMTPGADRFVRAETFFALARRPLSDDPYPHLTRADLLVVAPATANTLAKLAHGLADNLVGKPVLVSAGGTREPIDSVRFVGNRSSGRMGVALAEEARKRGADVTLLAANLAVRPPRGVEVIETPTAEAMLQAALAHADADVVLMAAAVADYRPADRMADKRAKDGKSWQVTLEPTRDILLELGSRRENGQVLVGFAADHGDTGLSRAREKLVRKGVDLVVFNDVARADIGFDASDNEVVLVGREGEERIPKAPKDRIAAAIVERAEELLRERT